MGTTVKWTRFKQELPKNACIFVTDRHCVWPNYAKFGDWEEYGAKNPEYAWAMIEVPKTPIDSKNQHACKSPFGTYKCYEDRGKLWLDISDFLSEVVDFCTWCGYSIKDYD